MINRVTVIKTEYLIAFNELKVIDGIQEQLFWHYLII